MTEGRIVSVNVGLPRDVTWRGQTVRTGIFKSPVPGSVAVRPHNLAGDGQADLRVHGGANKAVYAYPFEHYAYWRQTLGRGDLAPGMFGENLTVSGIDEDKVLVGEQFAVGTCALVATEPRIPCFKLGVRFGDPKIVKAFLAAGRPGIYFAVVEAGEVQADDTVRSVWRPGESVSIGETNRLLRDGGSPQRLAFAADCLYLSDKWRGWFAERLAKTRPSNPHQR